MSPADCELRTFVVRQGTFVLGPLDLSIRAGERIALLGPNGAGKTTLLRALAGQLQAYEGSLVVAGTEMLSRLPWHREDVGFLPEDLRGFGGMTVLERMRLTAYFYPRWDVDYANDLLRRLDLNPRAVVGTLSRGMKVKLSLVCAEAHRPSLLLLDEPTAGLDPVVRAEVVQVFAESLEKSRARTLVFSTHLLEDVGLFAERVIVLKDGAVSRDCQVADLMSDREGETLSSALRALFAVHGPSHTAAST